METLLHLARDASCLDDDSKIDNGFENGNSGGIAPELKEDSGLFTAGSKDFRDRESFSSKLLLVERR